jgi:hypothetical protein
VQAGRGGGHRPGLARIDRLVAFAILGQGRTFDVGRQRHLALRLEEGHGVAAEFELVQVAVAADGGRPLAAGQVHRHAGPEALAGARLGQDAAGSDDPLEQDLDTAPGRLPPVDPGRKDPGVVEDQQVARREEPGQVPEYQVPQPPARAVAGQQPARGTLGCRRLGDQLGGQLVVKVGAAHGPRTLSQRPGRQPPDGAGGAGGGMIIMWRSMAGRSGTVTRMVRAFFCRSSASSTVSPGW